MMNSKELIKKIDIGRVGNGSVSYNDMCLILNKEETLEHLQYIEQLEKENQELRKRLDSIPPQFNGYLYFAKSISNIINENTKLKKALDILKEKFALELGISVVKERYCYSLEFLFNNSYFSITKEDYELLKSVLGEE